MNKTKCPLLIFPEKFRKSLSVIKLLHPELFVKQHKSVFPPLMYLLQTLINNGSPKTLSKSFLQKTHRVLFKVVVNMPTIPFESMHTNKFFPDRLYPLSREQYDQFVQKIFEKRNPNTRDRYTFATLILDSSPSGAKITNHKRIGFVKVGLIKKGNKTKLATI
jgi:hypothetical protein